MLRRCRRAIINVIVAEYDDCTTYVAMDHCPRVVLGEHTSTSDAGSDTRWLLFARTLVRCWVLQHGADAAVHEQRDGNH